MTIRGKRSPSEKSWSFPASVEVLTFEGTEWEGASVTVRKRVPISLFFALSDLANVETDARNSFGLFADRVLVSWNLVYGDDEPDRVGVPIPASAEGIMYAPLQFISDLISRWQELVTSVPAPLGEQSQDGNM